MGGKCFTYGEEENPYKILGGGHKGKRPLRRPKRIRTDNIKIGLQEMGGPDAYTWHL
jgi:hypothetical protein